MMSIIGANIIRVSPENKRELDKLKLCPEQPYNSVVTLLIKEHNFNLEHGHKFVLTKEGKIKVID